MPFLRLPQLFRSVGMGIVVHSYAFRWNSKVESVRYPGFRNAIDLLEHCHAIGAGGAQVMVGNWSMDFVQRVRDLRERLGLYLEGSIGLPSSADDIPRFESEVIAAREAGATVLRTVCLSGRRYENFHSSDDFSEFRNKSIANLQRAEPVVRKHRIKLAIENHKDWLSAELLEILRGLDSEWIGVNLDFGNNIALLEDAMEVVTALAPYTFTTHVKDMGVREYDEGFLLSEVPLGEGFLDLRKMFAICRKHNPGVRFNLEMITRDPLKIPCRKDEFWATFPPSRRRHLARTLRAVHRHPYPSDLPRISGLQPEQQLAVEEQNVVASLSYHTRTLTH